MLIRQKPRGNDEKHLAALQGYWKRHRAFPAIAKLADVVGMSSPGSVFQLVGRLVEAGYLERIDGRIAPTSRFFARRMLGPVRAGVPQPTPDLGEFEPLNLDDYLIDEPDRTSLCRVRGDSMRDAALLDGDLVVVEQHTPPKTGDIVVAVVDDEVAIKYLRSDPSNRYFLESAIPAYPPIHPMGSLEVLGVVVGVARRLRR